MESISDLVTTANIRRHVAFSETPRVYVFHREPTEIDDLLQEAKNLAEEFVDACVTDKSDEDRSFHYKHLAFFVKWKQEGDLKKTLECHAPSMSSAGLHRLCSIIHNNDHIDDHQKLMRRLLAHLESGTNPVLCRRLTHTVKLPLMSEIDTKEQIITNISSMSGSVAEAPMSGQVAAEALNAIDEIHIHEEQIARNISSTPSGLGFEVSLQ